MKIVILGYGKMGRTIEEVALKRRHEIAWKIDVDNRQKLHQVNASNSDIVIEFSQPEAAVDNIKWALEQKIPMVCGTTGWLDQWDEIVQLYQEKNGTLFYASNYSIGVNIFFKLNQQLAGMMKQYTDYHIELEEIHHTQKKDAPSGTAITLAQGIFQHNPIKKSWVNETTQDPSQLGIISKREDAVPGTHTITYSSEVDNLEIKHTARSRKGFALGAVMAAEWVIDKKGVLGMEDFLAK